MPVRSSAGGQPIATGPGTASSARGPAIEGPGAPTMSR